MRVKETGTGRRSEHGPPPRDQRRLQAFALVAKQSFQHEEVVEQRNHRLGHEYAAVDPLHCQQRLSLEPIVRQLWQLECSFSLESSGKLSPMSSP